MNGKGMEEIALVLMQQIPSTQKLLEWNLSGLILINLISVD